MIIFYRIRSESPNMRKISLILEELGLPYAVKFVEPHDRGESDPEFAKLSPNGTVPAIVDTETGATLFESGAILYYLAERTGKLLPANLKDRADVAKWLMFEVSNVCPTMGELLHYLLNDAEEGCDAVVRRHKNEMARYCSILNGQLEGRNYLAGEYSIADVALYPWTVALEDMADIDLGDYPNLNRWATAIRGRSSAQQFTQASLETIRWCFQNGEVELCGA